MHPYKHPTIGSMKDLEAASIDDVREFFRTYYVPNNATLVLVGDFDSKEALALVTQYLGRVPKSDRPVPRDIPKEPPQTKERRVTLDESWPLPAVVVAHHITFDGHPDSYPLHIASKVLSDGQSSRIYRKLVYEKQIALAAFGGGNIIEDPNLFFAVAIVQPGQTTEEAIDALIAELDRLRKRADHARRSCSRRRTSSRATTSSAASRTRTRRRSSAHAVVIHNDIKTADGEFDIFMNITLADVQRVAQTYFTPENRLVLTIMPKGAARGGEPLMRRASRAAVARRCWRSRRRAGASAQVPRLAVRAAAAAAAGARRQVPAVPGPDAAERPAGDRGVAPRAAGGQPPPARPRRRRAGSGGQAGRRDARGVAARSGDDDEDRRADRQRRSTRSAARSAPAPAAT